MLWKFRTKESKPEPRRQNFERQMYIPKKTLQKKERTLGKKIEGEKEGKKKRTKWRSIVVGALWGIFIAEIVYVLFFAQFFPLETVVVEGVPPEIRIEQFVREQTKGTYFGVISKDNLLLLSQSKLEKSLRERYPRVTSLHTKKQMPNTLLVEGSVAPRQWLWCRAVDCFLLSDTGTLEDSTFFFQYPQEQGESYTIEDQTSRGLFVGLQVVGLEERNFFESLLRDFEQRTGLRQKGNFVYPSIHTKEVRIETEEGFWLYFSTQHDLNQTLNHLVLFLEKEVPKEERSQIEYIDLRTENRIFYTRKDRSPVNAPKEEKKEEKNQSGT